MGISASGLYNDVINSFYIAGNITVGVTEVLASSNGSSNLEGRQELIIYNRSTSTIYFGPSGVTVSTGIPIQDGEVLNIPFGDGIDLYLIAGSAGNTVTIQELG